MRAGTNRLLARWVGGRRPERRRRMGGGGKGKERKDAARSVIVFDSLTVDVGKTKI